MQIIRDNFPFFPAKENEAKLKAGNMVSQFNVL